MWHARNGPQLSQITPPPPPPLSLPSPPPSPPLSDAKSFPNGINGDFTESGLSAEDLIGACVKAWKYSPRIQFSPPHTHTQSLTQPNTAEMAVAEGSSKVCCTACSGWLCIFIDLDTCNFLQIRRNETSRQQESTLLNVSKLMQAFAQAHELVMSAQAPGCYLNLFPRPSASAGVFWRASYPLTLGHG